MQSRKDEILAKKAKLAELKRQKELRQQEFSAIRESPGPEVHLQNITCDGASLISWDRHPRYQTAQRTGMS